MSGHAVNASVERATAASARSWRIRPWPNDPDVAHLIFLDHTTVPTGVSIAAAVDHARRSGAQAIRTSALFPASAAVMSGAGFETIDTLALLRLSLADVRLDALPTGRPTRPFRPWHARVASEVDIDAFGRFWGNDPASLREIRHATPHHRMRLATQQRRTIGFAISGAAGEAGYLQRLAVRTDAQRQGVGSHLVADSLRWMKSLSLDAALVNTGVHNVAALELYERFGFRRQADHLTIGEFRIIRAHR